jgi:CheY-like chemotaxis protein
MEAGKYTLQEIGFDIHTVVQEVVELLAPRAHEKGIDLVHRIAPGVSSLLRGDPDRTRQILNNLVGNAIKFTQTGEVVVDVTTDSAQADDVQVLRVAVRDTGIGIHEADIGKLFDAFSQVDGSMVRKFGGTGLGLAISKHLVQMMGGTIGVNSEPGKGSEFWLEIPFRQEPQPPSSEDLSWGDCRRVLLIEPVETWRGVICEHFASWGLEVVALESAQSVLPALDELLAQEKPCHVVVVSSQLVGTSFEQMVQTLRRHAATRTVPIVSLYQLGLGASFGEVEKELTVQLSKPLRFSELYDTLRRIIVGNVSSHSHIRTSEKLPLRTDRPVLVVDDNEVNRLVAGETLEGIGYHVVVAANGAEALEMIKKEDYLIVLMDCQMPVMDGYAATRAVREWEKSAGCHTTIVALTAHALLGERDRVLAAGMDDYLTKPVRASSLDKMIRRYASSPPVADPHAASNSVNNIELSLAQNVSRSKRLIELFLEHVPIQLDDIERSISAQNAADLRAHAHKTKGSCLAFGAPAMARTSGRLQKIAETKSMEGASEQMALLREQYEQVLKALKALA